MQSNRFSSLYAFFIALLIHGMMALLILLFNRLHPIKPIIEEKINPSENRISISIKDFSPPSLLKVHDKPILTEPKQIHTDTVPKPLIPTPSKPSPNQPQEPITHTLPSPPQPDRVQPSQILEKSAPAIDTPKIPQPKKEQGLYDILSRADTSLQEDEKSDTKVSNNIQRLYGDKFKNLSNGEQKFILDNMTKMLMISNSVLRRYEPARIPANFNGRGEVLLEFYLHPNGDISGLKILKGSNYSMMNDLFIETINLSFSKFPHPEQTTLIRWIGTF